MNVPLTSWPSASSCVTYIKTLVCYRYAGVRRVRHHTWEVKCISSFWLLDTWCRAAGFMCGVVPFWQCYIMMHTAPLPCQQDKTSVVKLSKQSPLTATMSLWFDLPTGFLLPSLAILWQAQETLSALPDKKLDQIKRPWKLILRIQETAAASSLQQENTGRPLFQ